MKGRKGSGPKPEAWDLPLRGRERNRLKRRWAVGKPEEQDMRRRESSERRMWPSVSGARERSCRHWISNKQVHGAADSSPLNVSFIVTLWYPLPTKWFFTFPLNLVPFLWIWKTETSEECGVLFERSNNIQDPLFKSTWQTRYTVLKLALSPTQQPFCPQHLLFPHLHSPSLLPLVFIFIGFTYLASIQSFLQPNPWAWDLNFLLLLLRFSCVPESGSAPPPSWSHLWFLRDRSRAVFSFLSLFVLSAVLSTALSPLQTLLLPLPSLPPSPILCSWPWLCPAAVWLRLRSSHMILRSVGMPGHWKGPFSPLQSQNLELEFSIQKPMGFPIYNIKIEFWILIVKNLIELLPLRVRRAAQVI